MQVRGYLFVLCAAALWALIGPLSKQAIAFGVAPLEAAFWRSAIGWSLFAAHALATRSWQLQRADAPAVAAFGVFGVATLFGAYILSIHYVGAALASVLLYTAPAWVALLAWLMLGESMTGSKIVALCMTLLGVACVSLGPSLLSGQGLGAVNLPGILLGLLSGLSYATYYIFGKRYLGRYATPTLFLYALPVGCLCLLPFVPFGHKSWQAWLTLAVLGLTTTYGAYSVYYAGLRILSATRTAIVASVEPVLAAALAFVWWGERFDIAGYVGSALILGAVVCTILARPASRKVAEPEPAVEASA
ncbi:MAG: EamA family transporter [Deltaproteobacteria bacterium HGW-Deltaproteobacteria-8]|jgi:DME family drug/metabolite transporter|nr:MAG: EamA family transporter [Deltaproteobacteria bacterium HGW-Deltaproteobacteria-8]